MNLMWDNEAVGVSFQHPAQLIKQYCVWWEGGEKKERMLWTKSEMRPLMAPEPEAKLKFKTQSETLIHPYLCE